MKNKLLENLSRELGTEVAFKRYNLADMLSESYKCVYSCEEGSNLKRLAESHIADLKSNPKDVERLSRQLCILKELHSLTESGQIKDEELVDKEHQDEVKPKETRRILRRTKVLEESKETRTWGDWQVERGNPHKVKYYCSGMDLTNQVIGVVHAPAGDITTYGAEIYDNSTADNVKDLEQFESELAAMDWVESYFSAPVDECDTPTIKNEGRKFRGLKNIQESNEDDLTDEELEELAKHLESIRKERKNPQRDKVEESKEELDEADNSERYVSQYGVDIMYTEGEEDIETKIEMALEKVGIRVLGCQPTGVSWTSSEYEKLAGISISEIYNESKVEECNESYKGLENFKKQSESKAFYKTFKKLDSSLREGKALTRQESIDLYKASNSALTQLSIELEHNPEFLDTFKESVSILSKDVNSLLESLTRGKAPSKATMKSLAKFSGVLLSESREATEADEGYVIVTGLPHENLRFDDEVFYVDMDKEDFESNKEELLSRLRNYRMKSAGIQTNGDKVTLWFSEWPGVARHNTPKNSEILLDESVTESEEDDIEDEEIIVDETPDEDFVGADEGDIEHEPSPEEEEYDQEYADGRKELHDELADKHEETEDEFVQAKLDQDAEEVAILNGEDPEEMEDEEGTEEETPEDDGEITDDELAELKKHLKEMREAKKSMSEGK